jgi:hypothetical protein
MFAKGIKWFSLLAFTFLLVFAATGVDYANLTLEPIPHQSGWAITTDSGIPQAPDPPRKIPFTFFDFKESGNRFTFNVSPENFSSDKTQPMSGSSGTGLFSVIGVGLAFFARYKNTLAAMILGLVNFSQAGMKLRVRACHEVSPGILNTHLKLSTGQNLTPAQTPKQPHPRFLSNALRFGQIAPAFAPVAFDCELKPGRSAWRQPSIVIAYNDRKPGRWNSTRGPPVDAPGILFISLNLKFAKV